jgi:hypothetical protein
MRVIQSFVRQRKSNGAETVVEDHGRKIDDCTRPLVGTVGDSARTPRNACILRRGREPGEASGTRRPKN